MAWVEAGMHGEMGYLAREDRLNRRRDPAIILPDMRSIISVTLDYFTGHLPAYITQDPTRGRIASYAWHTDYHDVMLEKLAALETTLTGLASNSPTHRSYVDTGAILERDHAESARLGFTGKNTMLIHPRRGSTFFIGEILTTLPLAPDRPTPTPGCGTCTRCLKACPTDAFPTPYQLDARRCISYLTIELKGAIPHELRPLVGNWVYGCDICQDVCPWQRFAGDQHPVLFSMPDTAYAAPHLTDLLTLTEEGFRARYQDSPVYRVKRHRLVRNACVAAGNSGHTALAALLIPLLKDDANLVRGHAAWALGELKRGQAALADARQSESDAYVHDEITRALTLFNWK